MGYLLRLDTRTLLGGRPHTDQPTLGVLIASRVRSIWRRQRAGGRAALTPLGPARRGSRRSLSVHRRCSGARRRRPVDRITDRYHFYGRAGARPLRDPGWITAWRIGEYV